VLRKLFIFIIAAALTLPALAGAAQPANFDLSARTPGNATLRSAILPGWGQWFNGQNTKAYIIGSCAIAGVGATLVLNSRASATFSDYEKIGVKNDALYDDYEKQQGQAMSAGLFTAAVWIYGMIDAYVVAHKKSGKADRVMLYNDEHGFKLAFSKRF
jgi:hypothetical protein